LLKYTALGGLLDTIPPAEYRVSKSVILRMLNPQPGDRWEDAPAWSSDRGFLVNGRFHQN